MTVADIVESQFFTRLTASEAGGDGALAPEMVIESPYFRVKRLLDRLLAGLLLLPALPLIGVLIVAIRLSSRGPGMFCQLRVGKGGCVFTMYKLRSLRIDAEACTGPVWAVTGAGPRV